jgi:hypothetical protein
LIEVKNDLGDIIMKKVIRVLSGIFAFLYIALIPIETYASVDMADWELRVEKDIIDAYKIKANEKNVERIRDKDSQVGDIVEVIYEENTQSEKSGVALEPTDEKLTKILDEEFVHTWAIMLERYAMATGWRSGTWSDGHITGFSDSQGYIYKATNTEVQQILQEPSNWTGEYSDDIPCELLENVEMEGQYYPYVQFIYSPADDVANQINDEITEAAKELYNYFSQKTMYMDIGFTFSSAVDTESDGVYDYYNVSFSSTSIENFIPTSTTVSYDDWSSDFKVEYEKVAKNNLSQWVTTQLKNIDSKYALSEMSKTVLANHADQFFDISVEVDGNNYGIRVQPKTINENYKITSDNANGEIINNVATFCWQHIAYYTIRMQSDNGLESASFWDDKITLGDETNSNIFYNARKHCINILNDYYDRAYADSFRVLCVYLDAKYDYILAKNGYQAGNQRNLVYNGATFNTGSLGSNFYTLITSGYYYKKHALEYNGQPLKDISNEDILDIFLGPGGDVINHNVDSLYKTTTYNSNVVQSIQDYLIGELSNSSTGLSATLPQRYDIKFDNNSIEYTPFLTTSCIINNPLDRYEFWAENVSNANDKTYFGDAILLLPDERNLDGYLSLENHKVELDVNKNWGIFLITRYKYVNYVYKIYYGFYGATPQMILVKGLPIKAFNVVDCSMSLPVSSCPMMDTNQYGWFWKFSYSKKELDGSYYLTEEDINNEEETIRTHLMQNIDPDNDIHWLTRDEIATPNEWNNYNSSIWTRNNDPTVQNNNGVCPFDINGQNGRGDIYRYEKAVRAETIYYQVVVPYSVDNNGKHSVKPYILSVGDKDFDCLDVITLCDCEDEEGGCSEPTENLIRTSTITN